MCARLFIITAHRNKEGAVHLISIPFYHPAKNSLRAKGSRKKSYFLSGQSTKSGQGGKALSTKESPVRKYIFILRLPQGIASNSF